MRSSSFYALVNMGFVATLVLAAVFVSWLGWRTTRWLNWRFHHGPAVERRLESIEHRLDRLEETDANS